MSSSECNRSSPSSPDSNNSESPSISTKEIEEIKEEIDKHLEAIGDGFFATSGAIPMAVNPGLSIKGLGKVGLPLSNRDAKDLVKVRREAPFGKGDQKLVGPSVRKTWEIDPAQYAVSKTVEQLGVLGGEPSVRADLHKLLLYEEGGFFKTHRDTEKAPGMFATLVIMLPSDHQGGEVVVRLGKEKHQLSNPESNEFSYAFLAWNNANHVDCSSFDVLQKLLTEDDEAFEELVYLFDHQYSEANFGLEFLKGEDQVRGIHLHDACSRHGFSMFLAHFEHSERSKDDGDDDDDESDEWTLTKLFTPNGVCIAEHISIEQEAIIQDNPFEGDYPDHEESEGWLGNEDATCNEFYRRSCLVIVPENKNKSFLNRAISLKTGDWTDVLLQQLDDGMKADAAKNELVNDCSLILDKQRSSYSDIASLLSVALKLDMPSLLVSAMKKSSSGLGVEALCKFARAVAIRDETPWLEALAAAISALPRLGTRLGTIKMFDDEYRKTLALHAKPDSTPEEKLRKQDRIAGCMSDALLRKPNEGDLQVGDGDNEFLLLRARSQGNPFVLEVVLPICKLAIRSMDFVTDTVLNLAQDIDDQRLSHSTIQELIRDIVMALAQEISEHCGSKSMKDSKTDHFKPGKTEVSTYALHTASAVSYNPDLYKTQMSWKAITKLLCLCEKLGTMNCVPVLIRPLIEIAHAPGTIDLTEFLMPLISSLAQELPENLASPSHYHSLFQQALHHYILDHVGQKPAPPRSLVREGNKDKCYAIRGFRSNSSEWYDCRQCTALNDFLAASDRSEWRYKAAEPDRKHLDRRLYNLDCSSYIDKSHGTPYTLVLSKTDRSYREALNAWERRCAEAKSHIEGIGREKLKMFLGEQYNSIVEQLSHVTLEKTISTDRQPLVPMSTSTQNTKRAYDGVEDGPARKRATQVEIIDLC
ncbi:MAG: hypothetical protein Q9176_005624 [Flavoplaca citrina]